MKKFEKFENNLIEKFESLYAELKANRDNINEYNIIKAQIDMLSNIIKEYAEAQKLKVWIDTDENNLMKIGFVKA